VSDLLLFLFVEAATQNQTKKIINATVHACLCR